MRARGRIANDETFRKIAVNLSNMGDGERADVHEALPRQKLLDEIDWQASQAERLSKLPLHEPIVSNLRINQMSALKIKSESGRQRHRTHAACHPGLLFPCQVGGGGDSQRVPSLRLGEDIQMRIINTRFLFFTRARNPIRLRETQ